MGRFELNSEVWTDGRRTVAVFGDGALAAWDGRELVRRVGPPKGARWGEPPDASRAAWAELTGWPAGGESAGRWSLVPADGGLRIVGPERPERRMVKVSWERGRPSRSRGEAVVGSRARLQRGVHGTVLVDAEQGLVWCLDDGAALHLTGVNEEHYLGAARVPGGFVVHAAWTNRGGLVGRVDDDGTVRSTTEVYGQALDLFGEADGVWGVIPHPQEVGATLTRIDPETGALTRLHEVDYALGGHWRAGDRWVVLVGSSIWVFERAHDRWIERDPLERPTGDPTALEGRPRTGRVELSWEGPAGPFRAEGTITNAGRDHGGLRVQVSSTGAAQATALTFGADRSQVIPGEELSFGRVRLTHGEAVPVVVEGQAAGPAEVVVALSSWVHAPVDPKRPEAEGESIALGEVRVKVEVRGDLVLRRGAQALPVDPAWIAEAGDLLDASAPEPDLARWVRRALARARVSAYDEAADLVRAEWMRLSEADRAVASPRGIAAHKLRRGLGWTVTDAEAARLAAALGPGHPLGAFAAGGAFEVVSPAIEALLRAG